MKKPTKGLWWNDPNPIEKNDYLIGTLSHIDDEMCYITYNAGQSEAEVLYTEIENLSVRNSLNELEKYKTESGMGWICRMSPTGRGLRLHQTSMETAKPTAQEAVDDFLNEQKDE